MSTETPLLQSEETLLTGRRFNVVRRVFRGSRGVFSRDIVVFPEAVAVLPVLPDGRVLLIKQFRASVNRYVVEAPAGVVEPGENPDDTARRELVEETGFHPKSLIKIASFVATPGYSTEILHFYVASGLEYKGVKPEEYEYIETSAVSLDEAYDMVFRNEIEDMKTALLILMVYNMVKRGDLSLTPAGAGVESVPDKVDSSL